MYRKIMIDGKPVYSCLGDGHCWCQCCEQNGRFVLAGLASCIVWNRKMMHLFIAESV